MSSASAQVQPRATLELFTSQGCSSCPPADRLVGELTADPTLVTISLPVDYWDYLGWKDTLASPRNTARQRAYALTRGDGKVYTPQVVVNGSLHVVGSDRAAIERAIGKSRSTYAAMSVAPVGLSLGRQGGKVTVADAPTSAPEMVSGTAQVFLCGIIRAVTVSVRRGENEGRQISYHNVARRFIRLGEWSGRAAVFTIPADALQGDDIDAAAVLVQSGTDQRPRTMLGAAFAAIH